MIQKQDEIARIDIEGKFGVAKRRYGLGKIMAKLRESAETMIALPILIMNLQKILKDLFVLYFLTLYFDAFSNSKTMKNLQIL
jgi:transposase, IS5 family